MTYTIYKSEPLMSNSVNESPMAMHIISSKVLTNLLKPTRTCPSSTSTKLLISGTPGIRNSGLVAMAI